MESMRGKPVFTSLLVAQHQRLELLHAEESGIRIQEIINAISEIESIEVTAVEINQSLASVLRNRYGVEAICTDFLEFKRFGAFDRVLMNPPFEDASDIKHILHAWEFLKSGGRLVAICANGQRQRDQLKPWVEELGGVWEDLPEGTFESSGTNVNTALIVVDKP